MPRPQVSGKLCHKGLLCWPLPVLIVWRIVREGYEESWHNHLHGGGIAFKS